MPVAAGSDAMVLHQPRMGHGWMDAGTRGRTVRPVANEMVGGLGLDRDNAALLRSLGIDPGHLGSSSGHGHLYTHASTRIQTHTTSTSDTESRVATHSRVHELAIDGREGDSGGSGAAVHRRGRARAVIEACLCFDTTGSMYPYLQEVRKGLAALVEQLVQVADRNDADLRIGIIAHGDYCDKETSYVIRFLPLADMRSNGNRQKVLSFAREQTMTTGGDAPECYELALNKAALKMGWGPNSRRLMVMVGDALPHEPGYVCPTSGFVNTLDWREQLAILVQKKVRIYAVQAGGATNNHFWSTIARDTGGARLAVSAMDTVPDAMVLAVSREMGTRAFEASHKSILERRGGRSLTGELGAVYRSIQTVVVRERVVMEYAGPAGPRVMQSEERVMTSRADGPARGGGGHKLGGR